LISGQIELTYQVTRKKGLNNVKTLKNFQTKIDIMWIKLLLAQN